MSWHKPNVHGKLPKPRKTHALALVGTRMFLFGGHDGDDWLRDFHMLDIGTTHAHIQARWPILTALSLTQYLLEVLVSFIAEPLVRMSKPVLTVPVPESSLLTDLSGLLEVDISGPALLQLLKDEYSGVHSACVRHARLLCMHVRVCVHAS